MSAEALAVLRLRISPRLVEGNILRLCTSEDLIDLLRHRKTRGRSGQSSSLAELRYSYAKR